MITVSVETLYHIYMLASCDQPEQDSEVATTCMQAAITSTDKDIEDTSDNVFSKIEETCMAITVRTSRDKD